MPDSTPDSDAQREAFERGRRRAVIDGELESHEKRLNAINGSIERNLRENTRLRISIEELRDKIDAVAVTLATRDAVEASRDQQLKRANEQQISNRTFWLGVIAIITTLTATIIAAVIAAHGGIG